MEKLSFLLCTFLFFVCTFDTRQRDVPSQKTLPGKTTDFFEKRSRKLAKQNIGQRYSFTESKVTYKNLADLDKFKKMGSLRIQPHHAR